MKKLVVVFILFTIQSCIKNKNFSDTYSIPLIDSIPLSEEYFGKSLNDTYRNIENPNDSTITNWYKKQTEFANDVLSNITGRDSLTNKLYEVANRKSFSVERINITSNNNLFFLKKETNDSYYKLYYKENKDSETIILYDPKNYDTDSKNTYTINYIKPSWNGKYIVISLSYSGRELSDMIILDVENRKLMPQLLDNAWPDNFLGVNWLPDNSGFTYLRFSDTDISNPKFKRNSQSVLHLLKDKDSKVNYIFGNKIYPDLNISEKLFPTTKIHSNQDKYIIGYLSEVDSYWKAYYAKISDIKSGNLNWKPLYEKTDKIETQKGYFVDDKFIFLSAKNADNKKITSVNISDLNFNNSEVIVSEKPNEVINDFEITKDAIFYSTLKYGVDANLYKVHKGQEKKINTPKKAGLISLDNKSVYSDELWVSVEGWTSPYLRYSYDLKTNTFKEDNLSPKINYPEFDNIAVDEVLVKSHDGEEVPFSIVYKKDLKKNNKNPVFLYGYGAYGDVESPYFSSIMLSFVKKGGVFCIAHVRGGGEKGDDWHKSGYKITKSNSWKDLITCTEYLIEEKFTSKNHTAIYGASAGGILVGRAMTERPDLFKVVISEYGYLNPFRGEVVGAAGTNTEEFGSVKDSLECLSLINMDPYLNIKNNVDYPATYLTVGMNDPLVRPWMSGKFAARLQNRNNQKNPVLLLADFEAGHGGSSNELKIYEEWANIFSFIFWQTGHLDFQIK